MKNYFKCRLLLILFVFLSLISCKESSVFQEIEGIGQSCFCEEANFSGGKGILQRIKVGSEEFVYEKVDSLNVFNGDILLTDHQIELIKDNVASDNKNGKTSSTGIASVALRWPNKTVFYSIDPGLPNQSRVASAIAHWEAQTDINFVLRTNQPNYVHFVRSTGCASYIGMVGGKQNILLADGCTKGNTIHEIGHAVGLFHEHTRADRDSFVNISWNNITDGYTNNFEMYNLRGYSGFDNGSSLDFNSIMMYGSYYLSENGNPTITKPGGVTFSVQRNGLSSGDIVGVNQVYNAVDLPTPANATAHHDGEEELTATWDPVPGATKYLLYQYDSQGEPRRYRTVTTNYFQTEINNLDYLPVYRLWIVARDNNGNTSEAVEPDYSWK